MTHTVPFLDRRCLLRLFASLPILGRAGGALATPVETSPFPDSATFLVAGPDNGALDRWSRVVQPALAQFLPPETTMRRVNAGAPDGVTGANQFDALSAPDGQTVLLAPGEAALSWLAGDPRAQYDLVAWVPVMAVVSSGVVAVRPGGAGVDRVVRFATANPAGGDLPAILGLELLGNRVQLLPALPDGSDTAALADGAVDAVFLRGHRVPAQAAALRATGAKLLFALGSLDATGTLSRCEGLAGVPTLPECYQARVGRTASEPLLPIWCATAMASQTECSLVLPHLTPAAMVALWRHAGAEAAATLDVQSVALSLGVRVVTGEMAMANAAAQELDAENLLTLRRWLVDRFGWQPG